MPWFVTAVVGEERKRLFPHISNRRTFGFFNTYNEALEAIKENRCDMHEYRYDFLVIEYMEPGIHPPVHREDWFKWDGNFRLPKNSGHGKWMSTMKPVEYNGIVNWALG